MENKGVPQADILSGWKEIANYLRTSVRTAQRYEQQSGLPVRRPAGTHRGSVIATAAELGAWLAARPTRPAIPQQRSTLISAHPRWTFRTGIAEMGQLREEITRLRMATEASLDTLWDRVQLIHGDVSTGTMPRTRPTTILLENRIDGCSPFRCAH